jgi:signal transduction histidine kinase
MPSVAYQWAVHAGALVSAVVAGVAATVALRAWTRQRNPVDFAFSVAMSSWLTYLLSSSVRLLAASVLTPWAMLASQISYQITLVSVAFFILVSASITRLSIHAVWMVQGVLGLLLLAWSSLHQDLAYRLWIAVNLVSIAALCFYIGLKALRQGSYRCWLAFGGAFLGLGVCLEDMLGAGGVWLDYTFTQYFYAAFLLLYWLLMTNRTGRPEPTAVQEAEDSPTLNWEAITGFGPANKLASAAITNERQRIAQDLHDGVGSQLVNILARLDTRAPQQQAVAMALEQCLLDLKMIVDGIGSANDGLIDALGRLRYRVQHSLDKLGIRMIWTVEVDGPLQDFRGDRAQQVLRIAQECVANIMRHAHASVVEVRCRYVPESVSILLEVRDNGCGIPSREAGRPLGKGLESMRLRAVKLGGRLEIATKAKGGTRVRLVVPLHAPAANLEEGQVFARLRD